jgi:hypothetical protein
MRTKSILLPLVLALAAALPTLAQSTAPTAAQPMDPEFATQIKEWTTRPEFLSPLVDHLPKSTTVPSPKDILGYNIGAPKKLTYYADVLRYYNALAAKSPRVKVLPIGTTEEGRTSVIVFVGSEDSIAHLDTTRSNLAKLADPRSITDAQAKQIIASTKPIYTLSGGLHSAELGPPEMLMELAYRLATEDSELIQKIRDNVIVAIMPVADPDGRDRSIDWYNRYEINVTDTNAVYEAGVPYWGKYTKHDDNRDINYAGLANQNFLKWYLDFHPPIMHDLHESVWFLYSFSGQAPQNPLVDPITWAELPWFSNFEMAQLTKYGMPGVWDHGYVDGWSPGYVTTMSSNHNGLWRFYEILGNGGATTMHRFLPKADPVVSGSPGGAGGDVSKRTWFRPNPPYRDVIWSMRNNTNYAETGVLTALQLTAAFPQTILENFYTKSKNSIHAGSTEPPFAYVIPSTQQDMTRVAFVVHILRMQGIEVGRLKSDLKLSDGSYPAGSLIVKLNQPYGRLAKTFLSKQVDPDPELMTYDDSAWTMGLMTHTTITPTADLAALQAPVDPISEFHPTGALTDLPHAVAYAIPDHGSPNMVTLRYALADKLKNTTIQIAETAINPSLPAGTFIVPASALDTLKPIASNLGLDVIALTSKPSVKTHPAGLPRVAMFSTWAGTQDVGWVRFAFDQYHVPYDLIFKERVLKGDLHADYDILLIPNQARSTKALITDIPKSKTPIAYTKTDKFKFLGDYGSSDDITGGMGVAGVAEIQKFTEQGGLLVTLGTSSFLPADLGITPKIDASTTSAKVYAPGPIVEAEITQPDSPIFYGYTDQTIPVRYAGGPLLRMDAALNKQDVLMRFPGGDKSVLSGLFNGADEIRNRAAIVLTPVGKGEALLFTTNPIWRWQNLGEFRMLFNTLLNFQNLEPPPPAEQQASTQTP